MLFLFPFQSTVRLHYFAFSNLRSACRIGAQIQLHFLVITCVRVCVITRTALVEVDGGRRSLSLCPPWRPADIKRGSASDCECGESGESGGATRSTTKPTCASGEGEGDETSDARKLAMRETSRPTHEHPTSGSVDRRCGQRSC